MSDRAVIALAVAVCAGARLAVPVNRGLALAVVAMAFGLRRQWLLVGGSFLLAASLATAAWSGLADPPTGAYTGVAVLVRDPEPVRGAVRAHLRIDGRHVEAWARGAPGRALAERAAGEQVGVDGRYAPLSELARRRLLHRHVVARFDVGAVGRWAPGSIATRAANGIRRTLARGADDLDDDARTLLTGVVLGDDRGQPPDLAAAFRGAGLSHVLAVSGQNVAFVLAMLRPVTDRLGLRGRWFMTVTAIAFFGLLTRWEPSVLRAASMAAIASTAAFAGRPANRYRLLGLAVAGVVLVDPLLVHAIGFRLSVAATLGIAVLAEPIERRLPGPRWLASSLAITVAAQIGVAPVAVPAFGGLPLVAPLANVLAVPAAAPLTIWGLTGGILAGVAGPPFDRWLHLPTRLLTWWLEVVARRFDAL